MPASNKALQDLITSLLLIGLSIAAYLQSLSFPSRAAGYVHFVLVLILGLALLLAGGAVQRVLQSKEGGRALLRAPSPQESWREHGQQALVCVLTVVYVYLIFLIGYWLITPIYIALTIFISAPKRWPLALLAAALMTGALYLIFDRTLNVPLS